MSTSSSAMTPRMQAAAPRLQVAAPQSRGKKRQHEDEAVAEVAHDIVIDQNFLKRCKADYKASPHREILRNVVTVIGVELAATNEDQARKIRHEFVATHRTEHYETVDQEGSGLCWMYAATNMIRGAVQKKFESKKNIEFSHTYLFFFDKLERSNSFFKDIRTMLHAPDDDRVLQDTLRKPLSDGGCYEHFVNLVNKYGLVPKKAMPETHQTYSSKKMNRKLNERLKTAAFILRRDRNRMSEADRDKLVEKTLQEVYNDLVTNLGIPPVTFDWEIYSESEERKGWNIIEGLTPQTFLELCLPVFETRKAEQITEENADDPRYKRKFSYNDLVMVSHMPHLALNKLYECEGPTNVYGGKKPRFLNITQRDFEALTFAQWKSTPVYMCCDVEHHVSVDHGAIDAKVMDGNRVLDPIPQLTKAERLRANTQSTCHAMTIIGLDFDPATLEIKNLEIENTWGRLADKPGLDGFYTMSREAFLEQCTAVGVSRHLLSDRLTRVLESEPEVLSRWTNGSNFLTPEEPPEEAYQAHRRFLEQKRQSVTN